MKKNTKKIFMSSVIVSSILLIGCGSSGDTTEDRTQSVNEVLSKREAAIGTPSSAENFNNKVKLKLKREQKVYKKIASKMGGIIQKEESYSCSNGGVATVDTINKKVSFSKCAYYNDETNLSEYHDGIVQLSQDDTTVSYSNYYEELDYVNYPGIGTYWHVTISLSKKDNITEVSIDGDMNSYVDNYYTEEQKFSNFILKENTVKKTFFIEGGYSYKSGCFSENHVYNTHETNWLVESKDQRAKWSAGILYVDNATYTYKGLNVMVEKQGKKGEFTQQELFDEIQRAKNSTDCRMESKPIS